MLTEIYLNRFLKLSGSLNEDSNNLPQPTSQNFVFNGFRGRDLSMDQKEELYNLFKASYIASVGSSWSFDKFLSRVDGWLLFGDSDGFVTVREQRSGYLKLTGSAGNTRSILRGFDMLTNSGKPIWGVVTQEIANLLQKKDFIVPNKQIVAQLIKFIPSEVFGGANIDVRNDGTLTVTNGNASLDKAFVANKAYFNSISTNKEFLSKIPTDAINLVRDILSNPQKSISSSN